MRFLRNFMKTGTVLFVSHDTGAVVNLCSHAVLLNHGQIAETGTPKNVVEHYLATIYEATQEINGTVVGAELEGTPATQTQSLTDYRDVRAELFNASTLRNDVEVFQFSADQSGFGTGDAKISSVRLLDSTGVPLAWIVGGEDVILDIRCRAHKTISRPIIGFQFKDRLGQVIFADNTFLIFEHDPQPVEQNGELVARFEFRLPLLPSGDYGIAVAVADGSQSSHVQLHWMHDALLVRVHASSVPFGLIGVPMRKIALTAH